MHTVSRIIKIPCATFNIFRCFTKMNSSDAGHLESVDFSNEAADSVVRLTIDTIVYMKPKEAWKHQGVLRQPTKT